MGGQDIKKEAPEAMGSSLFHTSTIHSLIAHFHHPLHALSLFTFPLSVYYTLFDKV